MAIQELGGSELLLRFDDDYLGGLHAVQGESGRTFKYILVNPAGSVIDARPYNLTMTVAMKGGINQTTVQGKSDGTFEIEVTVDMLARYGKGDVQLMISEVETKKTLGTVIGTILIERNIAFDSGEGINLIFEFAELQQKIAFMSTLVEQGNENLNQAMVAKIEACNCADESVLARDESVAIKDSLSDVFETEEERKSNETQRIADEKIRLEKEVTRQSEEATRKSAEDKRIADEKTRESNETTRKSQETARQSAEDKRVSAETIRDEQEEVRKSNEIKRENNEGTRIAQEEARVTAEKERKTKFDGWDKTMQGVMPNATETDTGVVKVSALDTEEAPYTTVSIGKLNEEIANNVDSKISTSEMKTEGEISAVKTELGTQISELDSKVGTQYLDTNASIDKLESDVAKKQDKLVAGDNIDITRDTISATDTITTINGKTGAISKADITALGIPSQDTVYKKPLSEPISYIQGLQAELDSKVESYGTNPVLNIAVISAGGSTTGIPNNTLILELV